MRKGFLVALLGALVLAIGVVDLSELGVGKMPFAPAPAPELPSPPPRPLRPAPVVADLEAHPVEAVPGGRLDTQRLLRRKEFKALNRRLEELQRGVLVNIAREDEQTRVIGAFDTADPTLTPLLDQWVAATPDSFAPHLARAQHMDAVAWNKRGSRWGKDTSDEQRAEMREYLRKAVADAREALRRDPKLIPAYRVLIHAATGVGDNRACAQIAEEGLGFAPASVRIRTSLANCMMPRWGGSYAILTALGEEARAGSRNNPALLMVAGQVEWDRGRVAENDKRDQEAIEHYTRAIETGESWTYYESRACVYMRLKRYTDALADLARGLALMPEEPDLVALRAWTLNELQRPGEAIADVRFVAEVDPLNGRLASFRKGELEYGLSQGQQLLVNSHDPKGAIRRLTIAIQLTGGSGDAYYWRGRAYLALNDSEDALADFEEAVRIEPRNIESYRNIDYLLAKRGDWDGIIRRWSDYIALEPLSGQALFERAGAYHHRGDQAAAVNDLRKACSLGQQEACDLERRLAG